MPNTCGARGGHGSRGRGTQTPVYYTTTHVCVQRSSLPWASAPSARERSQVLPKTRSMDAVRDEDRSSVGKMNAHVWKSVRLLKMLRVL